MARGHYLAAAVSGIAAHNGHQAARLKGMGNSHTPGWARAVLIPTSLASAAIHVAATPVHFDEQLSHGIAFVVMSVLLGLAAVSALRTSRPAVATVAVVHGGILSLWLLSHTLGLPGSGVESVGKADALAGIIEAVAIVAACVALQAASPERAVTSDTPRRALWVGVSGVLALLAVPAVSAAGEHVHADSAASASITAIYAGVGHDHAGTAGSGGSGNAISHADTGPCSPSAKEIAAADKLVADTTIGLQAFRDVNAAVAAGYRPLGFEPNGVHHYINRSYVTDGAVLDPKRPEAILYATDPSGAMFAAGAMFMMGTPGEAGPRVGGCLTPWHSHGFPFAAPGEESAEMMHIWTIPLPGGPFAAHVEGEYARIYLGVPPLDTDKLATSQFGSSTKTGSRLTASTADGLGGVITLLNSLNVHREQLCSGVVRSLISSRLDALTMERICDPVLNGPLPGASAPPLTSLLSR